MRGFHKPVKRPGGVVETLGGAGGDPADESALAHDTAASLLNRVRRTEDPGIVDAVIDYADAHGIDDVAELWSGSPFDTLPGALWRLYLLRHTVTQAPEEAGYRFRRGLDVDTVGQAIAGSVSTPTPREVVDLATTILRGAFSGDFAVALERASGFARVMSEGSRELIGDEPGARSEDESRRVGGFADMSRELAVAARLWREDRLV